MLFAGVTLIIIILILLEVTFIDNNEEPEYYLAYIQTTFYDHEHKRRVTRLAPEPVHWISREDAEDWIARSNRFHKYRGTGFKDSLKPT